MTRKKVKRKDNLKLPQEVIVFPNADKDSFQESEDEEDYANIPRQNLSAIVAGRPNSGKSCLMKTILIHADPPYQKIWVVHVDPQTKEYNDIECEVVGSVNDLPDTDGFDPDEKTIVIIEDLDYEELKKSERSKLSYLLRYTHSHYGVSIVILTQNIFGVPVGLRRKVSQLFLFRHDINTMMMLCSRFGISRNKLIYIFDNICTDRHDSLLIDDTAHKVPRLRKNIFIPIDENELPHE
jgi:hypothetical protein